ncbi:hypothetical protein R6Q59_018855 [Mikania micrantha]
MGNKNKRSRLCGFCYEAHGEIHGVAGTIQLWLLDEWRKEKKPTKLAEEEDLALSTEIGVRLWGNLFTEGGEKGSFEEQEVFERLKVEEHGS